MSERDEYLAGGLAAVTCAGCGVTVLAKKDSPMHTSVQWSRRAVEECVEFAAWRALGKPTALAPGCGRLLETINRTADPNRLDAPAAARP